MNSDDDGRRGPCRDCGREMGSKTTYKRLGLLRHDGHQRCTTCATTHLRRTGGGTPRPPTPMRCVDCDQEMGTRANYKKLGLVRHDCHGRCTKCAYLHNTGRSGKRRSQADAKPPAEFIPPAAFKGRCDSEPDTFFPEPGDRVTLQRARKICQACPYKAPCLTRALKVNEPFGVFAGTTPQQRSQMSLAVLVGEAA